MSKMFNYDPYDHLQSLNAQVQILERNNLELVKGYNQIQLDIKTLAESVSTLQKLYLDIARTEFK